MDSNNLGDKKILIIGAGREGLATLSYLRGQFPQKELAIADKKEEVVIADKNVKTFFGSRYLDNLDDFDIVIKSPGIPSRLILPTEATITSPTQIFFDLCQGTIIGITGTKGKSTTTSLIYKILKDSGFNVELVGNIGKPAISFLSKDNKDKIYAFELSSFQLENLTKSPHIAVFLNIFEEHLDIHKDFQEYKEAKLNITKWQKENDYLVYNIDLENMLLPITKAIKIPFSKKEKAVKKENIPLAGDFNINNVVAAFHVAKIFNIRVDKIIKSIKTFKPLKHRLQNIGTYNGIVFYNDSIATNPTATMAAIDALGTDLQTLIVGGLDRGLDYTPLAQKILNTNVDVLILFPTTGEKIKEAIKEINPNSTQKCFFVQNMEEAIKLAYANTEGGKICLMSPAGASFNMFRDFEQRGEMFESEVKKQQKL